MPAWQERDRMLDGKRAIVSGAAKGIGRAICLSLAAAGADVGMVDMEGEGMRSIASEIRALGRKCVQAQGDVRRADDVVRCVREILQDFEQIDILVNSAGVCVVNPLQETTEAEYGQMMDVNVKGTWLFCREVLPVMRARGRGTIVNISSIAGKRGYAYYSLYSASKFAVIGMTQAIAAEYAPCGITVNSICPGTIMTPLWGRPLERLGEITGQAPEAVWDAYLSEIPLGRPQTPQDIASTTVFLCSEGGRNITGQSINVCGGQQVY
jgi:NAD(P)-dependent dehydrogenase (short-subunit alcohol dehydrogenase family)